MSRSTPLIAGLFGSFALSCFALVLVPYSQVGHLGPQATEEDGKIVDVYPKQNHRQGQELYVSYGCASCHTQQVRDEQNGRDLDRGWGKRRTVARDFIYDAQPPIGSVRFGPDLANYGSPDWRNEAAEDPQKIKRTRAGVLAHLYNPRMVTEQSTMPAYRYLFRLEKIAGQPSPDALDLKAVGASVEPGWQIVPKPEAVHIVNYLLSLDRSAPVAEVKSATAAKAAK